jgi:FtsP/CotA-like multicopper oxidase with cupredoxin domain
MNLYIQKIQVATILAGLVSLVATTQAVGMGMGGSTTPPAAMGGGMGTVSTTTIDPPRGALFTDPVTMPNISTIPGTVEVNLEAKIAPININGVTANLMAYNGVYPAPTIKVKKGDLLKVHFKNSLPANGTINSAG